MDNQNQQSNDELRGSNIPPIDTDTPPPMETTIEPHNEHKPVGPAIGTIIIVIILIIGGFYLWGSKIDKQVGGLIDSSKSAEDIVAEPDTATENLNQQSNSDEIDAIANDLNNTDLTNLDQELQNIDSELGI